MAQNCLKCLKYVMCAVNFLFFISGATMLGFGVYMTRYQTNSLLDSMKFLTAANLLLVSGIIVTCVSFLGFIGALKENRASCSPCVLMNLHPQFFILLLILMLVELTVACLLLTYESEIGTLLEKELNTGLQNEKRKNSTKTDLESDWNLVQKTFSCCGVHNSSDWGVPVPQSCCENGLNQCLPSPKDPSEPFYKQGCLGALKTWFENNFLTTGVAVIVLCVVEVLGMCIAMTLFCHISSSGLSYKL
ncbi:leukocyte surface antigen CD53-like isoform X2 [Gadus chalcogrammus]|uniref:leukocyte surface antigen CD53-like isoform X2 n=1 Tax=Gadus chalcogrammus TaxID=1042646 RepID=UPI0024C4D1D8|nr:leukocyte surface antigen CD53-like isoform X2 [Gadus chalcogrammus]